jgi:hypothetical protein
MGREHKEEGVKKSKFVWQNQWTATDFGLPVESVVNVVIEVVVVEEVLSLFWGVVYLPLVATDVVAIVEIPVTLAFWLTV